VAVAGTAVPGPSAGPTEGRRAWRQTYERLAARGSSSLGAAELDTLAEACFWLDQPDESVAVRRSAYAAHLAAGDLDGAAMAAWQLYYDHALVGETAVASGWLERAREHAGAGDGAVLDDHGSVEDGHASVVAGFVAIAEADRAHDQGDLPRALAHAARAVGSGRATGDRDLLAMALQTHGRLLVALHRVTEGVAMLDDAMVSVINGELRPLFTGWVYCAVLETCHGVADLRRAAEWTDAALRWCDGLQDGRLYPGLCRIHRVELACLRGAWTTAASEAQRACDELLSHDPRYAGDAVYLAAELDRLRGDLDAAEAGFQHAHELGREPQPGLALVWLARGRATAAVAALRLALRPGPPTPLARAGLLSALTDAELAIGALDHAATAAQDLATIARANPSPYLEGLAAARHGSVLLASDEVGDALVQLRHGRALLHELALPYEAARVQVEIAVATRRAGDEATALLELRGAEAAFQRLGAAPDLARTQRLLQPGAPPASPLSDREVEVLRLVAQGRTNRQIGTRLRISEHTVARHLSNIFTKLGVGSRAAATAYAYEHHLVP
jgi:DNA-binding CsgD family transcriptional regulator